MRRLAKRISQTAAKSFGMYDKASAAVMQGRDVIRMEFGRPHADTPHHIKQAAIDAINAGHVHYGDPAGEPVLREAAAEKLRTRNGLSNVSAKDILVTCGMSHATFATLMAVADPGDEIILFSPYYPQHLSKIELTGAHPVFVELDQDKDYCLERDKLEAVITPKSRAILLVNPANPAGRVYTRDELEIIAEVAQANDLLVISDEIYEEVIFDSAEHISIASLEGMAERTVSMFAFTKSHAMDGWRIGYLVAPEWLMPGIMKVTTSEVTHPTTFVQYGAVAALRGPEEALAGLVADDRAKRDFAVSSLNQMPGVKCALPQATAFVFPDISATGISSQDLAEMILDKADVAVEAGSFHGQAGEGHLRICIGAVSMSELETAMQRLKGFFNAL